MGHVNDSVETIFNDEIKTKKSIARGASFRASRKKGFKGSIKLPVDYLTGKEKKDYISGEVNVYNMYDEIISYDKFKSCDMDERKKILGEYLKRFSRKEIAEKWGVKVHTIHDYVYRLGLSEPSPEKNPNKNKKANTTSNNKEPETSISGFTIKFNGKYDGKTIEEKLVGFTQLLEADEEYELIFELAGK